MDSRSYCACFLIIGTILVWFAIIAGVMSML